MPYMPQVKHGEVIRDDRHSHTGLKISDRADTRGWGDVKHEREFEELAERDAETDQRRDTEEVQKEPELLPPQ
ncbi:hypothetical protein SJAG_00789 [Schizosaccharomyces japonicus yFS275]|uniref:Uncharacterized protein n=1 Tax=Schizosaccharomyces japonicus (strain yFS275 / FY16936) TaxID=402676 RepID=B6JWL2_SCHJY|nr:hypothetical protein SJAG_00789 [Schizosaccharomyces japonicus yFS275]EEB05763.1 hypothetical protein SJAG_00789 [Schizosaccharomyces japonicus yFS275]